MNKHNNIPFQNIKWDSIPKTEHKGETGTSFWQTVEFPGLRIRIVEYSKGYSADHWCQKGHIVHCLEGSLISEMENDNENKKGFALSKGNTYVVSDGMSSHRSVSAEGAKLLIIDGDFLNLN
ncbi:MAG: DHCW motif cupin fold protein [Candidatus Kapaibacterium sp.]